MIELHDLSISLGQHQGVEGVGCEDTTQRSEQLQLSKQEGTLR